MRHDVQDSQDASARARSTYTGEWHPILTAVEVQPAVWEMTAQYGEVYGVVKLVKRGSEVGYRADMGDELVGYFKTLRAAAEAVHKRWLRSHGQVGGINGA